MTGKGARTKRFALGKWRWPLFFLAVGLGMITTVIPVLVLFASSMAQQSSGLFSNWTLHFWIGPAGTELAQGQAGIFRDPILMGSIYTTIRLGLTVAATTMLVGLIIAHTIVRYKATLLGNLLSQLAFLPLFIPSIAMAAAYIAMYGTSLGPIPALYGTFTFAGVSGHRELDALCRAIGPCGSKPDFQRYRRKRTDDRSWTDPAHG